MVSMSLRDRPTLEGSHRPGVWPSATHKPGFLSILSSSFTHINLQIVEGQPAKGKIELLRSDSIRLFPSGAGWGRKTPARGSRQRAQVKVFCWLRGPRFLILSRRGAPHTRALAQIVQVPRRQNACPASWQGDPPAPLQSTPSLTSQPLIAKRKPLNRPACHFCPRPRPHTLVASSPLQRRGTATRKTNAPLSLILPSPRGYPTSSVRRSDTADDRPPWLESTPTSTTTCPGLIGTTTA